MRIENIRSSFMLYILDPNTERSESLKSYLKSYDYLVESFATLESALESMPMDPPHILFVHSQLLNDSHLGLQYIFDLSPETRIVILSDDENHRDVNFSIVHDVLVSNLFKSTPDSSCLKIVSKSCLAISDRVSELNYYMYMNEQLKEQNESSDQGMEFSLFNIWVKSLRSVSSKTEAIEGLMSEYSRHSQGRPIAFYKYSRSYKSLVSSMAIKVTEFATGQVVKVTDDEVLSFMTGKFTKNHVQGFAQHQLQGFEKGLFFLPLVVDGDLSGVFVVEQEGALNSSYIESCVSVLVSVMSKIDLNKKIKSSTESESGQSLLNREAFLNQLNNEVSRARRINLPTSLVVLSVDKFISIKEKLGPAGFKVMTKTLSQIVMQTSRVNDVVGQISDHEFGLILPHTNQSGAAIRAERLRDMISRAQFSKLVPGAELVTVSLGVADYPNCANDSSDLLVAADTALMESKSEGGDNVCLASAMNYFESEIPNLETVL